jgi:hypothetical protein
LPPGGLTTAVPWHFPFPVPVLVPVTLPYGLPDETASRQKENTRESESPPHLRGSHLSKSAGRDGTRQVGAPTAAGTCLSPVCHPFFLFSVYRRAARLQLYRTCEITSSSQPNGHYPSRPNIDPLLEQPTTTSVFPPCGPATGSCNGLHPNRKFLAKIMNRVKSALTASIVLASAATLNAADFFFKDGDKVAMMGDSITEQ